MPDVASDVSRAKAFESYIPAATHLLAVDPLLVVGTVLA
jgi:hypothetical protein